MDVDGFNAKIQIFKFLQSYGWGKQSYELWHSVTGYLIPNILRKHNGLIFKIPNVQEEPNTQWRKSWDVTQSSNNYMIEDKTGLKNIFWQETVCPFSTIHISCVSQIRILGTLFLKVLTLSERFRVV